MKITSLESARKVLKTMSDDEKLALCECIITLQSLTDDGMKYFINKHTGEAIEVFNLFKKVDCLQEDSNYRLLGLELMVSCDETKTWIMIDDKDRVTVRCYWGKQVTIQLGKISDITLEAISNLYNCAIDR